ncbi:hypothetical protein [Mucilaginibacter flavidus]|uniref:hypothetical protein n=1 Tax=Mucilaginibacter flavidus TaxID=2949309 RepID=UPI0020938A9B|nr:hypothetical protein [Mucilaginibacter flavidus]MCO5949843.1 hypothetical protein [Mucilaginibacter flavidus]
MPEEPKRLAPAKETLNRLFAISGNECAFQGCTHSLFDEEYEFIAEICHIEAAMPDGERFNPLQTNEERRALANLVGLCHQHHVKTDNVTKYPVPVFQQLKRDHEARFLDPAQRFSVPEEALNAAYDKIERIYEDVQVIKKRTEDILVTVDASKVLLETMSSMMSVNFDGSEKLEKEYQSQLEEITKLIDTGFARRAVDQLLTLKNRIWNNIKAPLKFKILTNIGVSYHLLQDHEKTAEALIAAYSLNPETEISLGNIINAYTAINDQANALKYLAIYKEKFPESVPAYGLEIKLKSAGQQLEAIEAGLPAEIRELPEIIANLGMAAKRQQNLPVALNYFKRAVALKPKDHFNGQLLLQTYLEIFSNDFKLINVKVISNEAEAQISYALGLARQLFGDIKDSEFDKEKIALYIAQGYLLGLLKQVPDALAAYDKGLEIEPENVFLKKNKAMLLSTTGNKPAALEVLLSITDYDIFPDLPAVIAETLQSTGEGKRGIRILEDFLAVAPESYYQEQSKHILLDLSINEALTEKVKLLRERYFQTDTVVNHLSLSRAARFLGETDNANEHLQKAFDLITDESTFKEKFFLAEELCRYKFYPGAIRLYEQIAVTDSDSEPTVKLYRLYHLTGENGKALAILKKLRGKYGPTRPATNLEIDIYQMLGDYKEAQMVSEEYINKFPEHWEAVLGLSGIYLRKGLEEKSAELIKNVPYLDFNEVLMKMFLAQLNALKQRNMSYLALYEYRRIKDDQVAHNLYYQHFFQFPLNRDAREKPEEITLDCVVTLADEFDTPFLLFAENRNAADARENEIFPSHPWFITLNGSKVGDIIKLAGKEWTVKAIEDKYFYAFKESQIKCETIYNESNLLKRFKIKDFTDIIGQLSTGQADWYKQFLLGLDAYQAGMLSFGALAITFDKEPIAFWHEMRAHQKGFFAAIGCRKPEVMGKIKPSLQDKVLCADITALLTIFELGIGKIICKRFGKLQIASSTYDLVYDFRESTRRFRADGKASEKAEALLAFIDVYTESVLPQKILTVNALEKESSDMILGKSFTDTLLLIQEGGKMLFSEDYCFRAPVEEVHQVSGIWTQAILMILEDDGLVTSELYQEKVLLLIDMYTVHTSIDSHILLKALNGFTGMPVDVFQKAMQVLSGKRSTVISATNVAYWFWVMMWDSESVTVKQKKGIIYDMLLMLTRDRIVNECFDHMLAYLQNRERSTIAPAIRQVHEQIRLQIAEIKRSFDLD